MSVQTDSVELPGFPHHYDHLEALDDLNRLCKTKVMGLIIENLDQAAQALGCMSLPGSTATTSDGYQWQQVYEFAVQGGCIRILVPERDGLRTCPRPIIIRGRGDPINGVDTVHGLVRRFFDAARRDAERPEPRRAAAR
jgi:hypothetical protein